MASGKKGTEYLVSVKQNRPSDVRLHKHLAACGVGSRRACERLMAEGRVTVDSHVVTEPGSLCDPDTQTICVDGRRVRRESLVYFMMNKPAGVLCTSDDPAGRTIFRDLLPRNLPRVFTVGRLDRDSEGLLLVTNDGDLAQRLMHPRYEVQKVYHVWVDRVLTPPEIKRVLEGIWDKGERLAAWSIRRMGPPGATTRYEIVLGEGRNRHIRRMLAALHLDVVRLRRVSQGPFKLGRLPAGQVRPLTPAEVTELKQVASPRAG